MEGSYGAIMKTVFNKIRLVLSIFVCKLSVKVCRKIGLGGTSLPGKIALKIYPDILKVITEQFKILTVTGTNGKTTTTGIIAQFLKEDGIEYITNSSGANLLPGITTTFATSVNWKGKSKVATALIEIDEGVFGKITSHFEPDLIVVTNFFRDQIDRFGGVHKVLERVRSTVEKSNNACLILNADDSLCASLGKNSKNRVIYYGLSEETWPGIAKIADSDTLFCFYCNNEYEYSYYTYEHLGGFKCPNCGYERPNSQITCSGIEEMTDKYSTVNLQILDINTNAKINLPGLFNIYNALAAVAAGTAMELSEKAVISGLVKYKPSFGRMEEINIDGKLIKIILVKNSAGFNQIIDYLLMEDTNMQLAFLINDKPGDGTDISWLWDVDFKKLLDADNKIESVLISGTRSTDMSERLRCAGINTDKIDILENYNELLDKGLSNIIEGQSMYILPTYTAMLGIRKILKKRFGLKEFWR